MRGQIEAVEDGLQPADKIFLTMLSQELYSLQHLVVDLQDLSLLETGNLRLDIQPLDICMSISSVINSLQSEANIRSIQIISQALIGPFLVQADAQRFTQIFKNLIRNAINYSDENKTISITFCKEGDMICISVSDKGNGIEESLHNTVFERLYRIDGNHYTSSGHGLGLAIVKQLCLAMNGDITLESNLGEGSTFTVKLPSVNA